ncbi:MAG TPA: hypothetical protein PKD99_11260, partial [Sphingopyxis sp.]|nr:hypothetical protein [Sphingopyxis sp.]
MMGALPQTATFALPLPLAAAGAALPQGGGEAGGFEQIVALQANAAAPVTAPDAAADAPVFSLAAPEAGVPEGSKQVAAKPIAASPDATEPQVETGDGKTAAPTPPKAEPEASGEEAVAVASRLAGTLGRFVTAQPARTPAAVKPGEAQEEGEAGASETDDDAPVLAWAPAPPAAAAPAADKPARDAARQPAAHRDDAPAMPMAAPKPREAAQPLPAMAFAVAEPQAAKPAAEPSMTVIFTQPAAQTAGIAEA